MAWLNVTLRAFRPVLRIYDPIGSEIGPEAFWKIAAVIMITFVSCTTAADSKSPHQAKIPQGLSLGDRPKNREAWPPG